MISAHTSFESTQMNCVDDSSADLKFKIAWEMKGMYGI